MNKYDSIASYIKNNLNDRFLTSEQIEIYEDVLNFIQREISIQQEEYKVDYNCPERAGFIATIEKSI